MLNSLLHKIFKKIFLRARLLCVSILTLLIVNFTYSQSISYLWETGDTTPTIDVNPLITTTYRVSISQYGVTYYDSITINVPSSDASFTYSSNSYSSSDPNPSPIITGDTGGVFSSTAGLAIDSSSGIIDISNTTSGDYPVSYITSNSICPDTVIFYVSIVFVVLL